VCVNNIAEIILWAGRRPWRRKAAPARGNDNAGVPGALELGGAWRTVIFNRSGSRSRICVRCHHGARLTPGRAYSWTSYGERLNGGHGVVNGGAACLRGAERCLVLGEYPSTCFAAEDVT
jgi:hypothetical protein